MILYWASSSVVTITATRLGGEKWLRLQFDA